MTAWPPTNKVPTADSPYFCDGEYGYDVLRVSPEGLVYGEMRFVAEVPHKLWWTGSAYKYVVTTNMWMSESELPTDESMPFGRIDKVRTYNAAKNEYAWLEYWWNSETKTWNRLRWLWDIDGLANLPDPGMQVGGAHVVTERHVLHFWNGYQFQRLGHSTLKDDEPDRHLPAGFLTTLQPDARVEYYSPTEIALEAVAGGSGKVLVNLEYVSASVSASVRNNLAVLAWDEAAGTITPTYIEPGTEYWIYLANSSTAFVTEALPADSTHAAAPAWDYRGKLFLSTNEAYNGYLGKSGAGKNARLVGKIETDSTTASEGGPYFLRELDISLISRQVSLPETYREFSDFRVVFGDQDTLLLELIDATYGQMYVGGNLEYLGEGYELSNTDPWIEWLSVSGATSIARRTVALSASSRYYLYIAGDVDPYNFNPENPDTSRPWQATDDDASGNYSAALDMRLKMFLSPKEPDHGFLDETWPGYYARHIGQVKTDANGKFINAWDLSTIRQASLNPSYFDGLAEIEITPVSATEVKVCAKKGSSGVVNVRGTVVQTYEKDDPDVHRFTTGDIVQLYTESNQTDPLSDLDAVSAYAGQELHLYLANGRSHWGDHAEKLFFSFTEPSGGYLSRNWPGNTARWICTVKPDESGQFTGAYITGTISISAHSQLFDDEPEKHRLHNDTTVTNLNLLSAAGVLFEIQKVQGLPVRLSRMDETHIKLAAIGDQDATVVLPDLTTATVSATGITAEVIGLLGNTYFVYLTPDGLEITLTAPDKTYASMQTLGDTRVLVGWYALGAPLALSGDWNVWSFSHEHGEFSEDIAAETTTLSLPGCIVPPGRTAKLSRSGQDCASAHGRADSQTDHIASIAVVQGSSVGYSTLYGYGALTLTGTASLSHESLDPGIYAEFTLTHDLSWQKTSLFNDPYFDAGWRSFSGKLTLTRNP